MTTERVSAHARLLDMALIALAAVLMSICAWISIPTPAGISFTLQTFGVFMAVGMLGGRRGTIAVVLYLLMGAVGLPVFSGCTGGIGRLAGTTGGYIVGFLFSALAMWAMERLMGKKTWVLALSMVVGLVVCYAFGTAWFVLVYASTTGPIGVMAALSACVFPYVMPDLAKIALALTLCRRLRPILKTE